MQLLERLAPGRWTLEWYLPWWLGNALGLEAAVTRELVLSNVLGLGSIRLQDDLADGEVADEAVDDTRALATALYEAALEPYRAWFAAASPFWNHLGARMQAWRVASDGTDEPGGPALAARGAPLHIAAFGACLLAGRIEAYAPLEACLDRALEALVRYDHLADWEADLDAGRWNAFVAATTSESPAAGTRRRDRTATYVAMLTTDAVARWFGRIDEGLLGAASIADTLSPPVPPLGAHLRTFAAGLRVQGAAIHERYRDLGDAAAKHLFRTPADARS